MRKLTLNADEDVIELARRLAKENGTSISSLFSRFVRALGRGDAPRVKTGRLTRQASGLLDAPAGFDEREALGDALIDKYGNRK